jgi:rhodanese-related sulfurtransferase
MTTDTLLQPRDAAARLQDGAWQLLDVRTDEEVAEGRIAGSLHIEMAQLSVRAGEIARERPVLVYCRSGVRSALAVEALRLAGYDAHDLAGGIVAWSEAGLPVEAPASRRAAGG